MMEKRYQVFVSSTYDDLKDERSRAIQTLMEMDCIPAGMELFPAADEEQWEFIKKVINDCDYYLLIIGGKYGSTGPDGLSYTEKEYDYAVERGFKIIALLHENPEDLPPEKTESDPGLKKQLTEFREKVAAGRLVKFWVKPEDIAGIVALSLQKTIKKFPAIGWVRANQVSNEELLSELNEIRKENTELKKQISQFQKETAPKIKGLAGLDENIKLSGTYYSSSYQSYLAWETTQTWKELFSMIGPLILSHPNESGVKLRLGAILSQRAGRSSGAINDQDFDTVKIQFIALGLIEAFYSTTVQGGAAWFWRLTPRGNQLILELRVIKKEKSSNS